ncbi:efflux RND transporter permease subunit [Aliikangiella sp. IMCC44653]
MGQPIIQFSLQRPLWVYALFLTLTLICGGFITQIQVDTDPENMLDKAAPARVYHNQIKQEFSLNDIIVVGVVAQNESIFNPQSLRDIKKLSDHILNINGVVKADVNSLSTIDNIEQAGEGAIRFEWMMASAPTQQSQANTLKQKTRRLPFVVNSLVSGDEKAATIYVPILDKDESYRIANEIRAATSELSLVNQYHITGLPVAEDTFGVEMFIQMGISAPLAALVIYLLMLYFFRSAALVTAPMIVAMATVIIIMGSMIGMGFTVHIMSSMIPIFLMPIAVVDSVHLMSEFADEFKAGSQAKKVIKQVTLRLFTPMLFTSVTSAAGFFSLALTPIPPVQVFGIFVGSGILLAFIATIIFIPAYVSRMSAESLSAMQAKLHSENSNNRLSQWLPKLGQLSITKSKLLLTFSLVVIVFSVFGVKQIQINDNPVRWFKSEHEIRVADKVLNTHFAGTYDAHLVFENTNVAQLEREFAHSVVSRLQALDLSANGRQKVNAIINDVSQITPQNINILVNDLLFEESADIASSLEAIQALADEKLVQLKTFLAPNGLNYISELQQHLVASGLVGKSNSLVDLVKTVNRELRSGEQKDYVVPETSNGVAQTLLQFQSSHRPHDLWHFVTPDYQKTLVWLQLKSGDNLDMAQVVELVENYIQANPLPSGISHNWAGKAYLNLIWQDKMVSGMLDSLVSAFVIVLLMMMLLFRSVLYGLLAMLPLSITILFMYGLIGWSGKYYDMPIAVLSSLTLGLSVDFAIHFIQRIRVLQAQTNNWQVTIGKLFNEPARAISRNAIVIALGFTPLLLAPLVPYITVGAFLATIMFVSAFATMLVIPASIQLLKPWLFKAPQKVEEI